MLARSITVALFRADSFYHPKPRNVKLERKSFFISRWKFRLVSSSVLRTLQSLLLANIWENKRGVRSKINVSKHKNLATKAGEEVEVCWKANTHSVMWIIVNFARREFTINSSFSLSVLTHTTLRVYIFARQQTGYAWCTFCDELFTVFSAYLVFLRTGFLFPCCVVR